jgi:hypothetical protein
MAAAFPLERFAQRGIAGKQVDVSKRRDLVENLVRVEAVHFALLGCLCTARLAQTFSSSKAQRKAKMLNKASKLCCWHPKLIRGNKFLKNMH